MGKVVNCIIRDMNLVIEKTSTFTKFSNFLLFSISIHHKFLCINHNKDKNH